MVASDPSITSRRRRYKADPDYWANFDITPCGCWLWRGSVMLNGYCRFQHNNQNLYVHRYSLIINGVTLAGGLHALHTCDAFYEPGDITYRRCGNPAHLYAGTAVDNARDRSLHGRAAKSKPSIQRLTDEDVRLIRRLRAEGAKLQLLADQFGISRSHIGQIVYGTARKEAGPSQPRVKTYLVDDETVRRAIALRAEGLSSLKISRLLNVGYDHVLGISRGRGRYAAFYPTREEVA